MANSQYNQGSTQVSCAAQNSYDYIFSENMSKHIARCVDV